MTIHGVILDVDGTLVSSNDAHAQSWVQAFADFGYSIDFDQVRPLIGMATVYTQVHPEQFSTR